MTMLDPTPGAVTRGDVLPHVREPWPLPGAGRTRDRLALLSSLARRDLPLVKVVEPHHDAAAVLADLGGAAPAAGSVWAVWAAEPPWARVEAREDAGGWRLHGTKAYCSGAGAATHALVTADVAGTSGLFAVDLGSPGVADSRDGPDWAGPGMQRADTRTLALDDVAATPVGSPGDYTGRPGFWAGAVGIAACWAGGAHGVADRLEAATRLDAHGRAHRGAVRADFAALDAHLGAVADALDAGSGDPRRLALEVRAVAASTAARVVDRVGRALGPGPLAHDREHAARVADLLVFVRQHHAERDLEELGSC